MEAILASILEAIVEAILDSILETFLENVKDINLTVCTRSIIYPIYTTIGARWYFW